MRLDPVARDLDRDTAISAGTSSRLNAGAGLGSRFNDYPGCAVCQKLPKFNVSLCRKNGSDRDLIELPGIAILRPFRSGIQVRIPEIIGSWVRRRRAKVDVRLVARNAVCAPEFDIVRVSRLRESLAPAFL